MDRNFFNRLSNIFFPGKSKDGDDESTPQNGVDTDISQEAALVEEGDKLEGPPALDEEVLRALGVTAKKKSEMIKFQPDLSELVVDWLTNDHEKDVKEILLPKYPREVDKCFIEAPALNPELKATLPAQTVKRDGHFVANQNITGSLIVATGLVLQTLLTDGEEVDKYDLIEKLSDSVKMIAQLHRNFSTSRRAFISPTMDKDVRATLDESKSDTLLYGEKLADRVKSAQALVKLGEALKPKPPPKQIGKSLNWKAPPPRQGKQQWSGGKTTNVSRNVSFRAKPQTPSSRTASYQRPQTRPTQRSTAQRGR